MTSGSMMRTSRSSVGTRRTSALGLDEEEQVLAVRARLHRARETQNVRTGDVPHAARDLLEARDHESLPLFDGVDVIRGLHQRVVRAGVEPGDATRELLDGELP